MCLLVVCTHGGLGWHETCRTRVATPNVALPGRRTRGGICQRNAVLLLHQSSPVHDQPMPTVLLRKIIPLLLRILLNFLPFVVCQGPSRGIERLESLHLDVRSMDLGVPLVAGPGRGSQRQRLAPSTVRRSLGKSLSRQPPVSLRVLCNRFLHEDLVRSPRRIFGSPGRAQLQTQSVVSLLAVVDAQRLVFVPGP